MKVSRYLALLLLVVFLSLYAVVPTFAYSPGLAGGDLSTVGRLGETLGYTFQYTAPSTMVEFMGEVSSTSTTFVPSSLVLIIIVATAAVGVAVLMLRRFSKALK